MLGKTLSGRFLLLTILFVLLAEVLVFVPAIARFREDYIMSRLERAQIASLSLLATDGMIDPMLETELLQNAEVFNVVLRRDEVRQLVLSSPIPGQIWRSYDMRTASGWELIRSAFGTLLDPQGHIIRVIGDPVKQAGTVIEATMDTAPMRAAMIDYGKSILGLSVVISGLAAALLFFAVQRLFVSPVRRLVFGMTSYAEAPEDGRRIIVPEARIRELREAEEALEQMERQLTGALKQKERLAQLGGAVAKISHDLRNILTTAQLFADRMEDSDDPAVKRAAPKLVGNISRAVNLCESTLTFGKAEEPPPRLSRFMLAGLAQDVIDSERLAAAEGGIDFVTDIPANLVIRADPDQLHRVLTNLVRNARQAILATGRSGTIEIGAGEGERDWWIRVGDTGPGLPERAREFLFQPFQGGTRKGGTGLGLAIAADLVQAHGGRIELLRSDSEGTEFTILLPHTLASEREPA